MRGIWLFSGRAGRLEWWAINIAIALIWGVATASAPEDYEPGPLATLILLPLLVIAIWLTIASSVRRLHDRDKSGWWYVVGFVPLIGLIWLIVECGCLSGTDGENEYGLPVAASS